MNLKWHFFPSKRKLCPVFSFSYRAFLYHHSYYSFHLYFCYLMILFFLSTFLVISCYLLLCLCALALLWKSLDFFQSFQLENGKLPIKFNLQVFSSAWLSLLMFTTPKLFFLFYPNNFFFLLLRKQNILVWHNSGCLTTLNKWS